MSVRTYGDKPISFQVEEGGEFYCIGSEVSGKSRVFIIFQFGVGNENLNETREILTIAANLSRF
jgi:hypothetical protein